MCQNVFLCRSTRRKISCFWSSSFVMQLVYAVISAIYSSFSSHLQPSSAELSVAFQYRSDNFPSLLDPWPEVILLCLCHSLEWDRIILPYTLCDIGFQCFVSQICHRSVAWDFWHWWAVQASLPFSAWQWFRLNVLKNTRDGVEWPYCSCSIPNNVIIG